MGASPLAGGGGNLELILMAVSVLVAFCGISLAWLVYSPRRIAERGDAPAGALRTAVSRGYYFDHFYARFVVRPLDFLSEAILSRKVEKAIGFASIAAPSEGVRLGSRLFSRLQNGNVQTYLLYALAGVVAILWVGVFHA